MKRITELGYWQIKIARLDGNSWEAISDWYGIPKEDIKKQYTKWALEGTTESETWFWTKKLLFFFFVCLTSFVLFFYVYAMLLGINS